MEKKEFKSLPVEVQEKIKSDLGMYDKTNVTFENGSYQVSPSVTIKDKYATDYKFIGTYKATEIFAREEHIIAQILSFGYSPTYNINFYRNKECWSEDAKKYETYRNQFVEKAIQNYIRICGEKPSQKWINDI